ncbi:MAG: hypothetical protein J6X55_03720 [Victivallales bacterium]|nr:hypothetical protein [Victivallales bacterium]
MKQFSKKAFNAPANEFYPGFFWMWNKKLERKVLFAEMDDMVEHGSRAVCLHPYPDAFVPQNYASQHGLGMSPDYLTDEYMDILSDVMDYAEKVGMVPWLYDEGGWPSGGACGQVLACDPERFVQRQVILDKKGRPEIVPVPYDAKERAPYPSIIEKGVTEKFLELTHEKFRKKFSRHFGKTIKFSFTDEPDMPRCFFGHFLGWCTDFADEFKKRYGYDVMPYLKDLLMSEDDMSDEVKRVRIDFMDLRSRLFNERYLLPIRDWCHANGLKSSGHLNCENMPEYNAGGGHGHILRAMRSLDVPGVDVIWRQLFPNKEKLPDTIAASSQGYMNQRYDWGGNAPFPKYASSAAHQNGESYVMSESFAIYGDGMSPGEMKWLVDYEMVRGITLFVFSSYSPDNTRARMGGGGPHFGKDDPYWPFMKPFFTYIARVSAMLAQGKPVVRTAVLYDIRSIWAGGEDARRAIQKHFFVSDSLLKQCSDFDFIDDDQLAEARLQKDGSVKIGRMMYDTIVLPTTKWLLPKARRHVKYLKSKGVRVLTSGQLEQAPRTCAVTGSSRQSIRVCKRVCGSSAVYFMTNEASVTQHVHITFEEKDNVVLCDPLTGKYVAVEAKKGAFDWTFEPYGSALFMTNAKADLPCPKTSFANRLVLRDWTLRPLRCIKVGKEHYEFDDFPSAVPKRMKLGSWKDVLGDEFAGTACYKTTFESPEATKATLDLGRVCQTASVKLNGKVLPERFFGPFRYDVELKKGKNTLEITVANALANATSPQWVRDYVEKAFPPRSPYEDRVVVFNKSNHESGLYGPVTIQW